MLRCSSLQTDDHALFVLRPSSVVYRPSSILLWETPPHTLLLLYWTPWIRIISHTLCAKYFPVPLSASALEERDKRTLPSLLGQGLLRATVSTVLYCTQQRAVLCSPIGSSLGLQMPSICIVTGWFSCCQPCLTAARQISQPADAPSGKNLPFSFFS
jgi:hypothetical protein